MSWKRTPGIPVALVPETDTEEVKRALRIFAHPEYGCEIRRLPPSLKTSKTFPGSDIDGLAAWVEQNSPGADGIYFVMNPVPIGSVGSANNDRIISRRWLNIDVDPIKAVPKTSATDQEKDATQEQAMVIKNWLDEEGWPAPVIVDSGNGVHLLYRIDMPNNAGATQTIKNFLEFLKTKFKHPAATVDTEMANAARISKLPGTWARKGENTPERPHRRAKLLHVPAIIEEVPEAAITKHVEVEGEIFDPTPVTPIVHNRRKPWRAKTGDRALIRAILDSHCANIAMAPAQTAHVTLNRTAYTMGGYIAAGEILEQEVLEKLVEAGEKRHIPEYELRSTIKDGIAAGKLKPIKLVERNGTGPHPAPAAAVIPPEESILVWASEVAPREVEWLMPGRIPLGKLTTFAGVGGLGKTFVLLDLAARVTTGAPWPDDPQGAQREPGKVIFASGEDDVDDTLVPRLMELGANLKKVAFFKPEVLGQFTLADLETLDRAIKNAGSGVKLVCIDPPTAYLGDVNDHNNAELRGLLSPLKEWSSFNRVAMVFITHLTKANGAVSAMDRVIGSVAWVNAVRAAHLFARDPNDVTRCVFVTMKMNLSKHRPGIAYRIIESGKIAKVQWLGEVDTTADEAAQFKSRPRAQAASEWLIEMFRRKLEWPSDDLFSAAKQAGVSKSALYEAKKILELPDCRYQVAENGDRVFMWWVPQDWPHIKNGETGENDTNDDVKSF